MQDHSQLTDSDAERGAAARQDLLASVLQRYEATTDERLRTIMEAASATSTRSPPRSASLATSGWRASSS